MPNGDDATRYDPRQLVEKLKKRGALIAYARLTAHPELAMDVAASRQKHRTLENFFVRFEMSKETKGVEFFDLFDGVDSSFFHSPQAGQYRLTPKTGNRCWLPGAKAQAPMAHNIWKAVVNLLRSKDGGTVAVVTEKSTVQRKSAASFGMDVPTVLTAPEE